MESLTLKQMSAVSPFSQDEIIDAIRGGHLYSYSVEGKVHFINGEPRFHRNDVRVERQAFDAFREEWEDEGGFFYTREIWLDRITQEPNDPDFRRTAINTARRLFEGACIDQPKDRYLAGVRDTLRYL